MHWKLGYSLAYFCVIMTYYIFISHRKLKKFHDQATNGETNIGSYIDDTSSIGTAAALYIDDTSSIGTAAARYIDDTSSIGTQ